MPQSVTLSPTAAPENDGRGAAGPILHASAESARFEADEFELATPASMPLQLQGSQGDGLVEPRAGKEGLGSRMAKARWPGGGSPGQAQ